MQTLNEKIEALKRLYEKHVCKLPNNKSRKIERVLFCQIVSYLLRKDNYSTTQIGEKLGLDHATVIHHSRQVEKMLSVKSCFISKLNLDFYPKFLAIEREYKELLLAEIDFVI